MSIKHYIFYHDEAPLDKVKPTSNLKIFEFVNLDQLPIPSYLRFSEFTNKENRLLFSEYLGILQIKPTTDMVGLFTFSIPLKFCEEYVHKLGNFDAHRSLFL
ncbi:MAG: hypothetical protein KKA19_05375, partial [Candidatus Margulisbacteria bacterium]|nr:hypothetical protein [Candidatus Margulisiibacteriota bacterium]